MNFFWTVCGSVNFCFTHQGFSSIMRRQCESVCEHSYLWGWKKDVPQSQPNVQRDISNSFVTHEPEDGHKQSPEEGWEGGQDVVGQIGHHKTRADDGWVQTLETEEQWGRVHENEKRYLISGVSHTWHVRRVWADLFIVVCIECQAEQVRAIFRRAVRPSAVFMLNVFKIEGWAMGITGGGPDQLGGPACVAQDRLQLPHLGRNTAEHNNGQRLNEYLFPLPVCPGTYNRS